MTYRLPQDIKDYIDRHHPNCYLFAKPEHWRKHYKTHIKKYRRHGFYSAITWGFNYAVELYIEAAIALDTPNLRDSQNEEILPKLKKFLSEDTEPSLEINHYLSNEILGSLDNLLSPKRLADLKQFMHLGLTWFKKQACIDLTYHTYQDLPQKFWLDWLLERTSIKTNKDDLLWNVWSQIHHMFWW